MKKTILSVLIGLWTCLGWAQTYNDGPIQLQTRVREVNTTFGQTDQGAFGVGFVPDELTYYFWTQDAANVSALGWQGGACLQDNFSPPTQSVDFNYTMFNFTYPGTTVPRFFNLRIDAWEDDINSDQVLGFCSGGTRCGYNGNTCCGVIIFGACIGVTESDDYRCQSTPFATNLDYRLGPPCAWYNHGFVIGGGCSNNYYQPRIESFWRYTRGTACNNAINLGNFGPGSAPVLHYNSNICYANNWPASGGNDVFYAVNITAPVGLKATMCAAASWNTTLYILDGNCNQIAFNDDFCAQTSEINIPLCVPGTYYIVVDGATPGDQGTFTLTLQENNSIIVNASAGPDETICIGTSRQIGGSPSASGGVTPYSYVWTPNLSLTNNTLANPIAYPSTTTQYVLTVTDGQSCVDRDTMNMTVIPGPAVNLGPDQTVCPGTFVTLDAGPGFVSYFWSNGSNSQTINVSQPGTYHVAVIDIAGCLGRDTVVINHYPTSSVWLGNDTSICQGASLTLDAGPGYTNYAWNTGAATQSISVTTAGMYDITTTDGNGCVARDTINVGVNPLPVVNLGPDTTVCPGDPATLDAGTGFVNYNWSNGSANQLITVTATGLYSVIVTDVNGCQGTDDKNVFNYPQPVVNLGPDAGLCIGSTRQLDAGPGWTSYAWSTGANTQQITAQFPGTFIVTVTNANTCSVSDTITLSPIPIPVFDLGNDTVICANTTLVLDPGAGYTQYQWNTGAGSQTLNVTATGLYSVTVTNGAGCQATDDRYVIVEPLPVVNLGPDVTICLGSTLWLDAGPGMRTYLWNTGSNDQMIEISASGTYTVTVTDPFTCTNTDNITVTVSPIITGGLFSGDTTYCTGRKVMLDPGSGYSSYLWAGGDSSQYLFVGQAGTYNVTVTTDAGCLITDDIIVTERTSPAIDLGEDQHYCDGTSILLDAGTGYTNYVWNTGAQGQFFTVTSPGYYEVTAFYYQCEVRDQVTIDGDCPDEIWVPNAFTPNGDNLNDKFSVVPNNCSYLHVQIYDKWGKMIYESNDMNFAWDGTYHGKPIAEGVYTWHITAVRPTGAQIEKQGTLTLFR